MSIIAKFSAPVELVITQVHGHVHMRLVSQMINGNLRVLQKLRKYFNGTAILTSFVLPPVGVFLLFLFWF